MYNTDTSKKTTANPGDWITVLVGPTRFDHDLVKYTDAKGLVEWFRNRDDPESVLGSNEDYMRNVAKVLEQRLADAGETLPCHDEEAFVKALFRIGFCQTVLLN